MLDAPVAPTRERLRHGRVARVDDKQNRDEFGRPCHPYRAEDIIERLARDKAITKKMWQAADDFRRLFRRACLDPLHAPDMTRPIVDFGHVTDPAPRNEGAARAIAEALDAVGGVASPAGSCLWHVVGCEVSLTEWADMCRLAGCPINRHAARGILIAALCPLAEHFERGRDGNARARRR